MRNILLGLPEKKVYSLIILSIAALITHRFYRQVTLPIQALLTMWIMGGYLATALGKLRSRCTC